MNFCTLVSTLNTSCVRDTALYDKIAKAIVRSLFRCIIIIIIIFYVNKCISKIQYVL